MKLNRAVFAVAIVALTGPFAGAQEIAARLFLAADQNRDGVLTRSELETTLGGWEALTLEQLQDRLERALPLLPRTRRRSPRTCRPCWPRSPTKQR